LVEWDAETELNTIKRMCPMWCASKWANAKGRWWTAYAYACAWVWLQ